MATLAKKQQTMNVPVVAVLGVLAVIGLAAWVMQLFQGFGVLGVGQNIVWGAYIAAFFLLLGAGSALVLFAAAGDLGFLPAVQPHRRLLLSSALGMFVAGGITILMDIGRPERVLNLLFSPQIKSPFIWDFYGLAITFIVTAVYLYVGPKGKWLPWLAAIVAALVVVIEGWILGALAARPLWHGGLMPVLFLIEALTAGSAFLLLAVGESQAWAKRALTSLLVVLGLVTFFDAIALLYSGTNDAQAGMSLLISGSMAPYFWAQVLLGILLPVILLVAMPNNRALVITAAGLAILGVLLAKLNVLMAGQAIPLLRAADSYLPTPVELAGVIGMLALGVLLGYLGLKFIPIKAEA